jgi:hypothetical protein
MGKSSFFPWKVPLLPIPKGQPVRSRMEERSGSDKFWKNFLTV